MSINRPFAYNPSGIPIDGTLQVGDLAIGVTNQNYSVRPGGVIWWAGPDEELGYVICGPVPSANRPTPIGNIGTVRFWRSISLTDQSFLNLVTVLSGGVVTQISEIQSWIDTNEYWTSWNAPSLVPFIGTGFLITMTIPTDGQIWGWGYNILGQLGDGSKTSRLTPVSIHGNKKTFCKINGGLNYTIGLEYNGQVWAWGYNAYGNLGDDSTTNRCTPVSVLGAKKTFCKITSGQNHIIVLQNNGQIWGWGYNNNGQLGDNTVASKRTPVSILGGKKTFCEISASQYSTFGIEHDGQVWSWGYNTYGLLGIDSLDNKSTPVSVLGNKKTFCKIAGGTNHAIGLDYNGQVWAWGYNLYGRIGDNSLTSRLTPVSILGDKKTFCKITGGQNHTVCIQHNGQVWSWGYNNNGQLGDDSTTSKRTPVSIHGNKKTFCQISTGQNHTIGIEHNGNIWTWGYNTHGQIGDNSTTPRYTPVRVCNI